jgi:hypothetical protein
MRRLIPWKKRVPSPPPRRPAATPAPRPWMVARFAAFRLLTVRRAASRRNSRANSRRRAGSDSLSIVAISCLTWLEARRPTLPPMPRAAARAPETIGIPVVAISTAAAPTPEAGTLKRGVVLHVGSGGRAEPCAVEGLKTMLFSLERVDEAVELARPPNRRSNRAGACPCRAGIGDVGCVAQVRRPLRHRAAEAEPEHVHFARLER